MVIKFCHTSCPSELSIYMYAKNMAFETALKSARNTHMRHKSVVLISNAVSMCTLQICLSRYKIREIN